jgi:hypothetical protein
VYIFEDFNDPAIFRLDRNRADLAVRNGIVRLTVIETLRNGVDYLERGVQWFKDFVAYEKLEEKDRNVVRVSATTIRHIVRGWSYLDQQSQRAFREGSLLPSTAMRLIKQTRERRR